MDLREQPAKKRERPKLYLTKEMVEERRVLKRLRRNARRNFSGGIPEQDRRSVVSDEDLGPATLFDNHETPGADEAIGRGSHQLHQVISQKKRDFLYTNSILDLGNRDQVCGFCEAHVWADEYTDIHVGDGPKGYSICCGKGKVQLPLLGETPAELHELLTSPGKRSRIFFNSSRVYNNMFAFSSFGGKIDDSVIRGKGPYVFRVSGETYHNFGSLVPPDGCTPKFAQLYMYDGQEAVNHRVNFPLDRDEVDTSTKILLCLFPVSNV